MSHRSAPTVVIANWQKEIDTLEWALAGARLVDALL
jgi:hypothetical protein